MKSDSILAPGRRFLALLGGGLLVSALVAVPTQAQVVAPPPAATGYGSLPATGQQYLVYIDGDPLLLDQIRLVQPDAFPTQHQGRTVIQLGRFNSYSNAQQQVGTLASQGLGATIAEVPAVAVSYLPPPATPVPTPDGAALPPLPVVPVPAAPTAVAAQGSLPNVEFGQAPLPVPTGTVETAPPAAVPTQVAAPVSVPNAPYYVVIPASNQELPNISSRLIQLGTPAAQIQNRTQPLGPHVAVGPFRDRNLAHQWSNFFRDAGYRSSRVHFEP